MFQQDNDRPPTSIETGSKLREFGLDISMQPPYSLDLLSSDYYLFLSLAINLKILSQEKLVKMKCLIVFPIATRGSMRVAL